MSVYGTFMDINAVLATIDEEEEIEESEVSSFIHSLVHYNAVAWQT